MQFKVILPAKDIPDHSKVTKITKGGVPYTLLRSIKVFGNPKEEKEIKSEGVVFLFSESGNITAVPETLELICLSTLKQLEEIQHRLEAY